MLESEILKAVLQKWVKIVWKVANHEKNPLKAVCAPQDSFWMDALGEGGSNFGSCVDILAPAVDVTVAWTYSNSAYVVASGTSFSAPLVVPSKPVQQT